MQDFFNVFHWLMKFFIYKTDSCIHNWFKYILKILKFKIDQNHRAANNKRSYVPRCVYGPYTPSKFVQLYSDGVLYRKNFTQDLYIFCIILQMLTKKFRLEGYLATILYFFYFTLQETGGKVEHKWHNSQK